MKRRIELRAQDGVNASETDGLSLRFKGLKAGRYRLTTLQAEEIVVSVQGLGEYGWSMAYWYLRSHGRWEYMLRDTEGNYFCRRESTCGGKPLYPLEEIREWIRKKPQLENNYVALKWISGYNLTWMVMKGDFVAHPTWGRSSIG